MPISAGSPRCTGAPCTAGKREVICTARMAAAARSGRIDTTSGPLKGPAGSVAMRWCGTSPRCGLRRRGAAHAFVAQRLLERERAAEHEGDQVVAPQRAMSVGFVDQLAVAPDAVARQVGAHVDAVAQRGSAGRRARPPPAAGRAWGCAGRRAGSRRPAPAAGSPGCPAPGRRPGRWCGRSRPGADRRARHWAGVRAWRSGWKRVGG
jgi:hypothetical protein